MDTTQTHLKIRISIVTMPSRKVARFVRRKKKPSFAKRVQRVLHREAERHHYDVGPNALSPSTTVNFANLTSVGQGDTDITRTGDRIRMAKLIYKYTLRPNATAACLVRLVLFQYNEDTGGTGVTTETDVLETSNTIGMYNWDEVRSNKITILYDKHFNLPASGDQHYINRTVVLYGKKLPRKNIQFDNTATTGNGHIYAMWFCDAASNLPSAVYVSRLEFYDS